MAASRCPAEIRIPATAVLTHDARKNTPAECRELEPEGGELLQRDATAGDGLGEQELEGSPLLLACEGPGACPDAGNE